MIFLAVESYWRSGWARAACCRFCSSCRRGSSSDVARLYRLLLLWIVYLLSMSAAVISLGLTCATALRQRGRAVAMTAGVIGLISVAGPVFADLRTAGPGTRNLLMGSPYSGANAMTLELAGYNSSELSFTIWALGWSLGYCICAVVLVGITIATFDRRLGCATTGGRLPAPIRAFRRARLLSQRSSHVRRLVSPEPLEALS